MAPVDTSYYELLEVDSGCNQDELSSAYKKRALKLHPDKGGSEEQFKAMKAAYDVLKDPQRRQLYDSHGPAVVRAMDGEVLEPEVMLEVAMSVLKTASRMVLCSLPVFAFILLFPAVVLALKWDGRLQWNWVFVFVPMWFVHVVVLGVLLKIRSVMATSAEEVFEAGDGESSRAEVEEKRRNAKRVLTSLAGFVALLLLQDIALAAKLQGSTGVSWFLVLLPYWLFECIVLALRAGMIFSVDGLPVGAAVALLLTPLWWGVLRLLTAGLLAAKADEHLAGPWMACTVPMIVGASCKVLWSCWISRRRASEERGEDGGPVGGGVLPACFAVAGWLSVLLLAASKLDGNRIPAFLVFLPFFLGVGALLCCCACLACCGPMVLGAVIKLEQDGARRNSAPKSDEEAQGLTASTSVPPYYSCSDEAVQARAPQPVFSGDGNKLV